ncbi:unnamed protein product [Angiostrongylus costaricensis]|uniref:Intraflagellar transport protein 43 homolog n=1 Tax=Angiostrongylus costaricensis TaxID=334426 RepID=A0A158PGG8_ANGCS|nr:unnamed protein product [Angiostrongylus costaricensis]
MGADLRLLCCCVLLGYREAYVESEEVKEIGGMNSGFSRKKPVQERKNAPIGDGFDDSDASELNIRVKDRAGDDVTAIGKRNRMGLFLKVNKLTSILYFRELLNSLRALVADSLVVIAVGVVDERSLSPDDAVGSSRVLPATSPLDFDAVARAPHLTVSQLHGMLQIDVFASKYPHLAKLDDLDISLLSRYLYTEEEVKDEDVPWTWDYIFASVSAELREEWAQEEADD